MIALGTNIALEISRYCPVQRSKMRTSFSCTSIETTRVFAPNTRPWSGHVNWTQWPLLGPAGVDGQSEVSQCGMQPGLVWLDDQLRPAEPNGSLSISAAVAAAAAAAAAASDVGRSIRRTSPSDVETTYNKRNDSSHVLSPSYSPIIRHALFAQRSVNWAQRVPSNTSVR